jgi:hypothetical protein
MRGAGETIPHPRPGGIVWGMLHEDAYTPRVVAGVERVVELGGVADRIGRQCEM